eukprot:157427_1
MFLFTCLFLIGLIRAMDHNASSKHSLSSIPREVIDRHLFPHVKDRNLLKTMSLNQDFRKWSVERLKCKLFRFIEGMTPFQWHKTSQGAPLLALAVEPLLDLNKIDTLIMIEELFFIILTHRRIHDAETKGQIAIQLLEYVAVVLDYHTTARAMLNFIQFEFVAHMDVVDTFLKAELVQLFKAAQEQYEHSNEKWNRYTLYAMHCLDIMLNTSCNPSYLWDAAQPAFIEDFLHKNISINYRSAPHIFLLIVRNTFYRFSQENLTHFLIEYKDEIIVGHEKCIMFSVLDSVDYCYEFMKFIVRLVIDNDLISIELLGSVLSDHHGLFMHGGISCEQRGRECWNYLNMSSGHVLDKSGVVLALKYHPTTLVARNVSEIKNNTRRLTQGTKQPTINETNAKRNGTKRKRRKGNKANPGSKDPAWPKITFQAWEQPEHAKHSKHCCSTQ